MNDLLAFKRNAIMLGLCGAYKTKWDSATSKEELMEIATDAKGMDMIADSISNEWGLSPLYIIKNFSDYIMVNGSEIRTDTHPKCMFPIRVMLIYVPRLHCLLIASVILLSAKELCVRFT